MKKSEEELEQLEEYIKGLEKAVEKCYSIMNLTRLQIAIYKSQLDEENEQERIND